MKWTLDRDQILTPADWRARIAPALRSFIRRDQVLVATLAMTGVRRSEAAAMRIEDLRLDRDPSYIRIRRAKGGRHPCLPIPVALRDLLRPWVGLRTEGVLWPSRKGGRSLSGDAINRVVMRLGDIAGIPWLHAHALRHLYGTVLYRRTNDLRLVQVRLGHASLSSTQAYLDLALDEGGAAIRGLAEELGYQQKESNDEQQQARTTVS